VSAPVAPPRTATDLARSTVRHSAAAGVLLGVVAAVCYTGTNIALRGVTRGGDSDWAIWVTALKSLPGALAAWILLADRAARGLPTLPSPRTTLLLLAVGLAVQAGGNLFFQWSLAMCGLALAVPTVFATLILTGATLGRVWLGESVSPRSAAAMGLLIAAIAMLGYGAEAASKALPPGPGGVLPALWVLAGVGYSAFAGVLYGALGVVIRRTTQADVPLPATLALVSTMGTLGLGIPAVALLGTEVLHSSPRESLLMFLAGTLNAIAFFAIGGALRRISVVQVNLINASQAAMCALGGVLIYRESLTAALVVGTLLTIVGLVLMDRRGPAVPQPHEET
jgi:drug/metabolite transporter (DMT)-like permease